MTLFPGTAGYCHASSQSAPARVVIVVVGAMRTVEIDASGVQDRRLLLPELQHMMHELRR